MCPDSLHPTTTPFTFCFAPSSPPPTSFLFCLSRALFYLDSLHLLLPSRETSPKVAATSGINQCLYTVVRVISSFFQLSSCLPFLPLSFSPFLFPFFSPPLPLLVFSLSSFRRLDDNAYRIIEPSMFHQVIILFLSLSSVFCFSHSFFSSFYGWRYPEDYANRVSIYSRKVCIYLFRGILENKFLPGIFFSFRESRMFRNHCIIPFHVEEK